MGEACLKEATTTSPAVSHTNPNSLKPKRKIGLVGRLDVDNYEQTITREEYLRSRDTRSSVSVLGEC